MCFSGLSFKRSNLILAYTVHVNNNITILLKSLVFNNISVTKSILVLLPMFSNANN